MKYTMSESQSILYYSKGLPAPWKTAIWNAICRNCLPVGIAPPYLIARNFRQFHHLLSLVSCVNDYIEDMATFTALVKIYSTEYFCNAKVAGLG